MWLLFSLLVHFGLWGDFLVGACCVCLLPALESSTERWKRKTFRQRWVNFPFCSWYGKRKEKRRKKNERAKPKLITYKISIEKSISVWDYEYYIKWCYCIEDAFYVLITYILTFKNSSFDSIQNEGSQQTKKREIVENL